jgi:hypothetical protein
METTTRPDEMVRQFPLANDSNGDPIDLPPQAVKFRVRKMPSGRAGRPKSVFDRDTGRQLEVPLDIQLEELAERVTESGRYRLEAIDASARTIPGCIAFTEVEMEDDDDVEETTPSSHGEHAHLVALVEKVVDSNTRVMEAMASAFGQVRPHRQPMAFEMPPAASPPSAAPPPNPGGMMGSFGEMMQMGQQIGGMVQQIMALLQLQKAGALGIPIPGMPGVPPMATEPSKVG